MAFQTSPASPPRFSGGQGFHSTFAFADIALRRTEASRQRAGHFATADFRSTFNPYRKAYGLTLEIFSPKHGDAVSEEMISQLRVILGFATLIAAARAADVTLLAVGPFGQPVQGCQVDSFRTAAERNGARQRYSDRFQGLASEQIPFGQYEVRVVCGEAEIYKQLTVAHANQFEVVALSGRRMISDHVKAKLAVKLEAPAPPDETWWIRLAGLYNGKTYTDRFAPGKGEAAINDPDPGSYLVTISSAKGYSCVREVDFVEATNAWTFHPASCSFEFDRFAHLVQDEDKRNQKQDGWYDEMRADRDDVRRAIDEALKRK